MQLFYVAKKSKKKKTIFIKGKQQNVCRYDMICDDDNDDDSIIIERNL